MPRQDEAEDLVRNCKYVLAKYKDTYGFFYLSDNGNAIFLPEHSYWTSTPAWINMPRGMAPDGAYNFNGDIVSSFINYAGLYIRPVQ